MKNRSMLRSIVAGLALLTVLACSSVMPGAAPAADSAATNPPVATVAAPTEAPAPTSEPPTAVVPTADTGILFQEDFSTNDKGWDMESTSDEYGQTTREIVDGQYVLTCTGSQDYYIVLTSVPGFKEKDFILSMDVTVLENALHSGDFSIEFSLRETDGIAGRHYAFNFYNDATSYGEVWPTGNYEDLVSFWENEPNSAIQLEPGVKNTIRIEAVGSNFTVYVNDQLIKTVTDNTILDAGVASINLALNTPGQTVKVAFDNLVVTKP